MAIALALSPLFVVAAGALLLMLVEAFSKNTGGLALGSALVLFTAAAFAEGVWLFGVEHLGDLSMVAPYLIVDRFTLFFDVILCLGGGIAALLAGKTVRKVVVVPGKLINFVVSQDARVGENA